MRNYRRAKWMDPDFRRDSKTPHYCVICQRDLKPGQPHRLVQYELDRYEAIHPEEWETSAITIAANRPPYGPEAVIVGPIGMDCARRLGLEWSKEP